MTTIAEIFDLPKQVHQGDFVLRLTEGVDRPAKTLDDYVVTPQLVNCFNQALSLISSALESDSSKGAYLHGSFGSGKSHFMAVLTLLLNGNAQARSIPELAGVVREANNWTEGRQFLVVPYHMIGATSMESAIFGRYASYVRSMHPEAPTPGFYQSDRLFENARSLRETMGDDAFFRRLNETVSSGAGGSGGGNDGWGDLAAAWDPSGFEEALVAPPGSEERMRLVGDLIDAYFDAVRTVGGTGEEQYVSLDEGLVEMSRHAQSLGYDALVLFLDELVLWLASHAADSVFVSREGQKVAKLVEAMQADRPIPIVSFIARQRDLRELVGEHVPGADQLGFADVLNWWEARFDEVTLEDRNLPAIVERRVLRVKDETAQAQLDEAFVKTARVRKEVLATLLTREGDREMFRQVYPFTPALVQTLIAVSSLLQRERTALKLMMQLLIEQGDRLELGDVIPVGDLFDVIVEGDEPFTQAMKLRFEDAKKLYRTKLLPLLETEHGLTAEAVRSGDIEDQKLMAFRNDDRLMKTMLLSALAEGVEALRSLTPARLAALNHGTVRSPIPGQESSIVLTKCRQWAAQVGEIKVSDDSANPVISLQIVGVDTESILENASALDNQGNRIQRVRQLLYEAFGVTESGDLLAQRYDMIWRGSRHTCELVFRNVREMRLEDLRNTEAVWQIVIDWPFDDPQHSPRDDLAKIQEFRDAHGGADTLVWLPSFLNASARRELGRLVLLEQVLTGNRLSEYGAHLSQVERDQARILLTNQCDQMRNRMRNYLLTAYGIRRTDLDAIDDSHGLDEHFLSLNPQFNLQPPVSAGFGEALNHLFAQALAAQHPDHPEFDIEIKRPGLKRVLGVVERAAADAEERVEVERRHRDEVRCIAVPLGLGEMGETHFRLGRRWVDELDRKSAQHAGEALSVADLRSWIEAPERRGLQREVQNLVIIAYALSKGLRFVLHGGPAQPSIERLDDALLLEEQALPSADHWARAVEVAGAVFGAAVSPLLNAQNVGELVQSVRSVAAERGDDLDELVGRLGSRLQTRHVSLNTSDRYQAAAAALSLVSALSSSEDDQVIPTLANAEVPTSEIAMSEALKGARDVMVVLDPAEWSVLDKITALPRTYQSRVESINTRLDEMLRLDEHVMPLVSTFRLCRNDALELLTEAATAERPAQPQLPESPVASTSEGTRSGHRVLHVQDVGQVVDEIEVAARDVGATRVEVNWKVTKDEDSSA